MRCRLICPGPRPDPHQFLLCLGYPCEHSAHHDQEKGKSAAVGPKRTDPDSRGAARYSILQGHRAASAAHAASSPAAGDALTVAVVAALVTTPEMALHVAADAERLAAVARGASERLLARVRMSVDAE